MPLTDEEMMAYVHAERAPTTSASGVEFIDAIPKSPSGKILRRELVERERSRRSTV